MKELLLITGASSGVGQALTEYLSSRFMVIAMARRQERLKENFKNNDNVSIFQVDVADQNSLSEALDGITERFGCPKYIINNAGVMHKASIDLIRFEDIRYSIELNSLAPVSIIKYFLPALKKGNFGRIINITSGAPLNCFPEYGAYSASKAILNTLTVTLSKELAETNIKVNLMSPGPVRTEMAPDASMDPSVCFPTVDYLLNLEQDGPSGKFFWLGYEIPLFPDLKGVNWGEGTANSDFREIL